MSSASSLFGFALPSDNSSDPALSAPLRSGGSFDRAAPDFSRAPTPMENIVMGVPGALLGFIDTVGQSVGVAGDKTVANWAERNLGQLGTYYAQNDDELRFAGDIAGMFIPGILGVKAISGTGWVARTLQAEKIPYLRGIFTSGNTVDELVAGVRAADALGAAKGVFNVAATGMSDRASLVRSALRTGTIDSLKKTIAFEASVALTMNASDTLYPEDMTLMDALTWNIGLPLAGVAVERAILRRAIASNLQDVSRGATSYYVRNPLAATEGAGSYGVNEFVGRPVTPTGEGGRDGLLMKAGAENMTLSYAMSMAEATGDGRMKSSLEAAINANRAIIADQFGRAAQDSPISGYTKRFAIEQPQLQNLVAAAESAPDTFMNLTSVEPMGVRFGDYFGDVNVKNKIVKDLYEDATAKAEGILAGTVPIKDAEEAVAKFKFAASTSKFVLERDGAVTLWGTRKPLVSDNYARKQNLIHHRGTATKDETFEITAPHPMFDDEKIRVAVTADGVAIISNVQPQAQQAKKTTTTTITEDIVQLPGGAGWTVNTNNMAGTTFYQQVNRLNMAEVVYDTQTGTKIRPVKEETVQVLSDYAQLFQPGGKDNVYWQQISQQLPPKLVDEIKKWTQDSRISAIRGWAANNAPEFKQLYDAFEPFRDKLREIFPDQLVPLYRGESKVNKEDVTSWSTSIDTAVRFGKDQVVLKYIHIDDIVMPIGGLKSGKKGSELEYIVKNSQARHYTQDIPESAFVPVDPATLGAGTSAPAATKTRTEVIEEIVPLAMDFATPQTLKALDISTIDALQIGYREAARSYKPGTALVASANDTYMRYDFLLELADRHGEAFTQRLKFVPGMKGTVEELEYRSLRSKYDHYIKLRQLKDELAGGNFTLPAELQAKLDITSTDMARILNLPVTGTGSPGAVMQMFETFYQQGRSSLADGAITDLASARKAAREIATFPAQLPVESTALPMRGRAFAEETHERAAVGFTTVARDVPEPWTYEASTRRAIATREFVADKFRIREVEQPNSLVSKLWSFMAQAPETSAAARSIETLIEGAQSGAGVFEFQNLSMRGVRAVQGADAIQAAHERILHTHLAERQKPYTELWSRMRASQPDMDNFSMFVQSRRLGWDLKAGAEFNEETGRYRYLLDNTPHNKELYRREFGTELNLEVTPHMPLYTRAPGTARKYVPMETTELAHGTVLSIGDLGTEVLNESNFVRNTLSLPGIRKKEFWIPPVNLRGQSVRYIVRGDNEFQTVIAARTEAEVQRKAEQYVANNPDAGLVIRTQESIAKHMDIQDQVFAKLIDYSDPMAQTGRSRGATALETLPTGPEVLNELIGSLNNQFEYVGKRARMVMFEPQIQYARQMGDQVPKSGGGERNIFSRYITALLGETSLRDTGLVGGVYRKIESTYDEALNVLHDRVFPNFHKGATPGEKPAPTKAQIAAFEGLKGKMGDYTPFSSAAEYAEATFKVSTPQTLRKHAALFNNVTAALALRIADVGHALLNVGGLMATAPAVIKGMNRLPNESVETWRDRINAFGMIVGKNPDGSDAVPRFDIGRTLVSATHYMFTPEGKAVLAKAAKEGYIKQTVAELADTMSSPYQTMTDRIIKRGVDYLSVLSDKSEEFARGYSFMAGYHMAKRAMNFANDADAFVWAHKFANDMIGDYRPHNRPQIFQGAVGMPLGLFTTYMWNYMSRLYGYVENRQVRAFMTQYGMQTALFGAKTVPGFVQYNEWFASNYDGSQNPVDNLQQKFGPAATDWFIYGSLSTLPKYAAYAANGFSDYSNSGDGIALYTRGDANVQRIPGLWSADQTPVWNLFAQSFGAIGEMVGALRTGGLSATQTAEIVATHSISRPLRNLIEVALGESTDVRGQVINDDTRSAMSVAARALGLRPFSEQKTAELYFRMRGEELKQSAMMQDLRQSTRAAMRGGEIDEESMGNAIRQYLRFGGSPNRIGEWIRDNYIAATVERADRKFIEAIRGGKLTDVMRLADTGTVGFNEE